MSRRAFTLLPRHNDTIRGDVRMPAHGASGSTVLIVHGFKGFKDWAFFPYVAGRLAEAGHVTVSFNFSRNGVGEDLQEFTELEKFGANTLSLEREEVALVFESVRDGSLLGADPGRIGLLGHSRGGGQAVLAAADPGGIDALVTWASVATFDRWDDGTKRTWRSEGRIHVANQRTGQQMPLDVTLLDDFESHREQLDVLAAASRIDVPWLVVHGAADATVSISDARALADAGVRTQLKIIEEAGHTFEARHPFERAPLPLLEALDATVAHLARALHP